MKSKLEIVREFVFDVVRGARDMFNNLAEREGARLLAESFGHPREVLDQAMATLHPQSRSFEMAYVILHRARGEQISPLEAAKRIAHEAQTPMGNMALVPGGTFPRIVALRPNGAAGPDTCDCPNCVARRASKVSN